MSQTLHGIAVAGGIAIGRVALVRSRRRDVPHYLIDAAGVDAEARLTLGSKSWQRGTAASLTAFKAFLRRSEERRVGKEC